MGEGAIVEGFHGKLVVEFLCRVGGHAGSRSEQGFEFLYFSSLVLSRSQIWALRRAWSGGEMVISLEVVEFGEQEHGAEVADGPEGGDRSSNSGLEQSGRLMASSAFSIP